MESNILLRLLIVLSVALPTGATTFALTDLSQYVPAGDSIVPYGINDSGEIVGTYLTPGIMGTLYGFTLQNGVFQTIDSGTGFTTVNGVNNLGQFVGNDARGTFIGTSAGITQMNIPGAVEFNGINDLGEIVGPGFTYQGGVVTPISIGGNETTVFGVNDAGQIVGFYWSGGVTVAFEESGGTVSLVAPDSGSIAYGINNNGVIITRNSYDDNGTLSYIPGGNSGLNDLGQVVGGGYIDGEFYSLYVQTPIPDVPEPAAWMLVVAAGLAVFLFAKRTM